MRFHRVAFVMLVACDCGSTPAEECTTAVDCDFGFVCVDRRCQRLPDGAVPDSPLDVSTSDGAADAADTSGLPCVDGRCVGDARCVDGTCVPWDDGEFDETCTREAEPGPVIPQIQCAFEAAPDDDPMPTVVRALHTPLVANFGIRPSPDVPSRPSVAYVADYGYMEGVPRVCTASGILRIIDGATCRSQGVFTALPLNSPVTPAIGDLDGDGALEVVAAATQGGLVALDVSSDGTITQRWVTTNADGSPDLLGSTQCQWGAVSIYDLDDDDSPEILLEGGIWDADGVRVGTLPGWVHISHGTPVPAGDFDGDGRIEIVAGNATWERDDAGAFVIEAGFSTTVPAGFQAIADLGDFPGVVGDAPGLPEVVSAMAGSVSVRTLAGGVIATIATSTSGNGGPPTIADFDGDGVRELGVAFGGSYEVFDLAEAGNRLWTTTERRAKRTV